MREFINATINVDWGSNIPTAMPNNIISQLPDGLRDIVQYIHLVFISTEAFPHHKDSVQYFDIPKSDLSHHKVDPRIIVDELVKEYINAKKSTPS